MAHNTHSLKLKVCGMKNPENMREVAAIGPDYMGFIFFGRSPRNFEGSIPELPSEIRKTGVFVDAPAEFILEKAQQYRLQAVQLHGRESPQLCEKMQREGLEVIKVFSVKDSFDFSELEPYEGKVDFFLFDTKGKAKGGNGIIFDWEVLKDYPSKTPFFLSGGLGLEEIQKLRDIDFPDTFYGIDVNSKFETEPGLKKIEAVQKIKTYLPLEGKKE